MTATTSITASVNFEVSMDFGTISVRKDFRHEECLSSWQAVDGKSFHEFSSYVTDENFGNPTTILSPGDKMQVRAYSVVMKAGIMSANVLPSECLAFLESQPHAVFPVAQGLRVLFQERRNNMPAEKWYVALDAKERLGKNRVGALCFPALTVFRGIPRYRVGVYDFNEPLSPVFEFLSFTNKSRGRK